jgi:hypothetical protein
MIVHRSPEMLFFSLSLSLYSFFPFLHCSFLMFLFLSHLIEFVIPRLLILFSSSIHLFLCLFLMRFLYFFPYLFFSPLILNFSRSFVFFSISINFHFTFLSFLLDLLPGSFIAFLSRKVKFLFSFHFFFLFFLIFFLVLSLLFCLAK